MHREIRLLSGLQIPDVDAVLDYAVDNYAYFDAVPVAQDSSIIVQDIALSIMVNSRISGNTAAPIFDGRGPIEASLASIPAGLDLVDVWEPAQETWFDPLISAVECLDKIERVGLGIATKVLHKKRPGLVPMFDSFVGSYYRSVIKKPKKFRDLYLCFHRDLRAAETELRRFVDDLNFRQVALTHCRLLEYMVWFVKNPALASSK
jgi:hypothetical protein